MTENWKMGMRNWFLGKAPHNSDQRYFTGFLLLGLEEHFMTDYGDEGSYKLPWDLFYEESAVSALHAAS